VCLRSCSNTVVLQAKSSSSSVQPDTRPRVHPTRMERRIIEVLVPELGDLTDCSNHRGLTLLPTITKLFTHLLLQLVRPHVELYDYQYGFCRGRGTGLFALDCRRAATSAERQTDVSGLPQCKAYDRVMHHAFHDHFAHKGVSGKMWRLIDALYQRCSARVSLRGCLSSPLTVHSGVAQGAPCPLFCVRSLWMTCLSMSKPSLPTLASVLGKHHWCSRLMPTVKLLPPRLP
jgi:hypothetical protein